MRNKLLTAFLLGLITALLFGYTRSWTESTPTDSTVANQIDDYNRYLRVDVAERIETYIGGFNASDSNEGFYHVLFLEKSASPSTPAANKGLMYGLLSDSKCELTFMDEDGDEIQLSYTGKHMIGSGTAPQAFMYNTTEEDTDGGRESTIRAKGEQSGGEVTTLGYTEFFHDGTSDDQKGGWRVALNDGDDSDAPSKFPIEYASDGTIDANNSASVLDEDDMASDSATRVATQQSIKAYVDGATATGYYDADGTTIFNTSMTTATTFQDLDIATQASITATTMLVFLEITGTAAGSFAARPNGEGGANYAAHIHGEAGQSYGGSAFHIEGSGDYCYMTMATDSSGIIEIGAADNTTTFTIKLIGYVK